MNRGFKRVLLVGATLVVINIFLSHVMMMNAGILFAKKPLPDPFLMNDGSRVQNAGDWNARREEIKETLLSIEYGHVPGAPDIVSSTETWNRNLNDIGMIYKKISEEGITLYG